MYALSNKYGEHGMMKVMAYRRVPKVIRIKTRRVFIDLRAVKTKRDER